MTEEEAKTKWCPFARVLTNGGQTANRTFHGDGKTTLLLSEAFCIGSACMAWKMNDLPNSRSGFCGLAGRP